MLYNHVIEVNFNFHVHPEHGCDFGVYRVGDRYLRSGGAFVKCEDIIIDFDDGMHAICYFEDGTVEHQWNINKIIEGEYDPTKKYQGGEEVTELPKPSSR